MVMNINFILCSQAELLFFPLLLGWGITVIGIIFTGILRQNEQRCEQEIEDIKQGMLSGSITPESSRIRFSDEALDEQKHSIRIADEKVALAVQAYDLVWRISPLTLSLKLLKQYMLPLSWLTHLSVLIIAN